MVQICKSSRPVGGEEQGQKRWVSRETGFNMERSPRAVMRMVTNGGWDRRIHTPAEGHDEQIAQLPLHTPTLCSHTAHS